MGKNGTGKRGACDVGRIREDFLEYRRKRVFGVTADIKKCSCAKNCELADGKLSAREAALDNLGWSRR